MTTSVCRTCADQGVVVLPVFEGTDMFPCYDCKLGQWGEGFPGVSVKRNKQKKWIIEPKEKKCS